MDRFAAILVGSIALFTGWIPSAIVAVIASWSIYERSAILGSILALVVFNAWWIGGYFATNIILALVARTGDRNGS